MPHPLDPTEHVSSTLLVDYGVADVKLTIDKGTLIITVFVITHDIERDRRIRDIYGPIVEAPENLRIIPAGSNEPIAA